MAFRLFTGSQLPTGSFPFVKRKDSVCKKRFSSFNTLSAINDNTILVHGADVLHLSSAFVQYMIKGRVTFDLHPFHITISLSDSEAHTASVHVCVHGHEAGQEFLAHAGRQEVFGPFLRKSLGLGALNPFPVSHTSR